MERSSRFPSMSKLQLTHEQYREIRRHFWLDPNPSEKTLEALADALNLKKKHVKAWFHMMQNQRLHYLLSKIYRQQRMLCRQYVSRATTQTNPEESSQNDPGLPEALEALKNLTLSGFQSTVGPSQDC